MRLLIPLQFFFAFNQKKKFQEKEKKNTFVQKSISVPGIGDGCRLPFERLAGASSGFPDTKASNGSDEPDNGSPFSSAASFASTSFERRYISFRMVHCSKKKVYEKFIIFMKKYI